MKKTCFVISLCLAICLVLSACGNTGGVASQPGDPTVSDTESISSESETERGAEEQALLGSTYKIPLHNIYIDIPNLKQIESGYSRIYLCKQYYIAFTFLDEETAKDNRECFDKTFLKFRGNIEDYQHINDLGEYQSEDVTVGGVDAYKIKGTMSAGNNPVYDAYVYAYNFVYDGVLCQILGGVIDEAQTEDEIREVTEIADAMMKTIRSTPER